MEYSVFKRNCFAWVFIAASVSYAMPYFCNCDTVGKAKSGIILDWFLGYMDYLCTKCNHLSIVYFSYLVKKNECCIHFF